MTIADKLMYIPNYDTQYYPLCRLKLVIESQNIQFIELINQNQKVPKVDKPTYKKTLPFGLFSYSS